MNASPLGGRTALVTGSGRGLGRAIATQLAKLGANIVVHDISREAPAEFGEAPDLGSVASDIERLGVRTVALTADIGSASEVHALVETAEARLGPIGILVNCAGGDIAARGGKPKPNDALGIPAQDIEAIMNRNLVGTMLVSRAVCPGMAQRRSGTVVNIASAAAQHGVTDGVAYAVAKAGIVQFTRCLAKDLRPHGVRVNAISPGPTMTARFMATRKTDPKLTDPRVPLERYGLPEEIADAVAFFCGDGSRFVSGQVLCVDGGLCLFPS
jgi:NAD(P)-dependent dehydrogenase (short-subunit alcohol dehydrogenase family)